MTGQPPDAWQQLHDLLDKYTKEWEVRPDLKVVARATDRTVDFQLGRMRKGWLDIETIHFDYGTTRNIHTMRELAQALLDACDFVEGCNPKWANLPDS